MGQIKYLTLPIHIWSVGYLGIFGDVFFRPVLLKMRFVDQCWYKALTTYLQ